MQTLAQSILPVGTHVRRYKSGEFQCYQRIPRPFETYLRPLAIKEDDIRPEVPRRRGRCPLRDEHTTQAGGRSATQREVIELARTLHE